MRESTRCNKAAGSWAGTRGVGLAGCTCGIGFGSGHNCVQIGIEKVKGEDIPYRDLPSKATNKAVSEFWDNLMDAFVTYLGKHARAACNPKGQRIGKSTAVGYCGAVKNFLTDTKFQTEKPIPVFQKAAFRKLTDKLQGMFRESDRAALRARWRPKMFQVRSETAKP
jgi:hypothetical protein